MNNQQLGQVSQLPHGIMSDYRGNPTFVDYLLVLIIIGILSYGAFWLYKRLTKKATLQDKETVAYLDLKTLLNDKEFEVSQVMKQLKSYLSLKFNHSIETLPWEVIKTKYNKKCFENFSEFEHQIYKSEAIDRELFISSVNGVLDTYLPVSGGEKK